MLIDIDKRAAASIAAAIVLVVIAWLWSGGEEEVLPPQTEVAALPVAESVAEAEPAVEQVVQAETVTAPVTEVEPLVEQVVQAEAVAAPVTEVEPPVEQVVQTEAVAALIAVAEPAVEPVVQTEAVAAPVAVAEPAVEQVALAETVVEPEAAATVAAETSLQAEPVAEAAEAVVQDLTDAPAVEGLVVGSLLGVDTVAATDEALLDLAELPEQKSVSGFDPNEPVLLSELEFIKFVEPRYPNRTLNRSYDGTVEVVFRVSAEGRTFDVEVSETDLPRRFKSPSVAAVKKWRFQPYLNDGQPVEVISRVLLRYAN
jgi:TonB family protein